MSTETKNELLLRVASEMEQELSATGFETVLPILVPFSDEEARTIARILREAAEGWRPINEVPEGVDVLLYRDRGPPVVASWHDNGYEAGWRSFDKPDVNISGKPTRWLPLPYPPSGTRK